MKVMRQQPVTKDMAGSYEIISATFADSRIPEMKKRTDKPYVNFGSQNDYPDYILTLYRKSAKHQAIINGKVTYITGNGLSAENDTPQAEIFLSKANEKQSWNDLLKITCLDVENNGGFYLQCIPKMGGVGYNYYHVPFKRMRIDESESCFFYKKDWKNWNEQSMEYPKFKPGIQEASIFYFKEYNPDGDVYPLPSWVASCNWIESDIEVSKHTLTNALTGFSASKFINFYNGEPDERKKKSIQARFENAATGSEGKKILIGFNNDPSKKPTIDDLGTSDLTKEDFTAIDNLITNNIFAGAGVTHPLLFGIQQESKLGSASELKTAYEIFKNTYITAKQRQLESVVNYFARIEGIADEITIVDVQAIGDTINLVDFKDILPKEWIFEKLGIDATQYGIAPTMPTAEQVQSASTNSILTNLSGRQMQGIARIVKQYGQNKVTKQQASLMLKNGFGFSDEDVNAYLGIDSDPTTDDAKFESQYNEVDVAEMFSHIGNNRDEFTIIKSKSYSEDDDEFSFAFRTATELKDLEVRVSEIININNSITALAISEMLKISVETVQELIRKMEADGVLSGISGGVRKLLKPPTKSVAPELLVRYSYEKRPEATGPSILPTTRPFCAKLVAQDRLYSRQDIQTLSMRLGYSVFKRSGGFWNHNGITDSQCRHEWRSQLVIKNK
jgi:DNA-binding MarR family transcriptional regulator